MRPFTKRVGAVLGALLVVAVVALVRARHGPPTLHGPSAPVDDDADRTHRWQGFPQAFAGPGAPAPDPVSGAPGAPAAALAPPAPGTPPADTDKQDAAYMDRWRQAILDHNREDVLFLDELFLTEPPRFGPRLEIMAQSDPDERVRAFCTRVLGKYKNPAVSDVFDHLLTDTSPFVREDAAWALGELGERPAGKQAASGSVGGLQRLQQYDQSPDVRAAAALALKKLQ